MSDLGNFSSSSTIPCMSFGGPSCKLTFLHLGALPDSTQGQILAKGGDDDDVDRAMKGIGRRERERGREREGEGERERERETKRARERERER